MVGPTTFVPLHARIVQMSYWHIGNWCDGKDKIYEFKSYHCWPFVLEEIEQINAMEEVMTTDGLVNETMKSQPVAILKT